MESIQQIVKVVNNQAIINLPPGFADSEVEVILKKRTFKKDSVIKEIEKEIDLGLNSSISPRTHEEVFINLKDKYATS